MQKLLAVMFQLLHLKMLQACRVLELQVQNVTLQKKWKHQKLDTLQNTLHPVAVLTHRVTLMM